MKKYLVLILTSFLFTGCFKDEVPKSWQTFELWFSFENSDDGWVAGYSDYPADLSAEDSLNLYEMSYGHSQLPGNITPVQSGIRIRGNNKSDDLFMYFKKSLYGLMPETTYSISFEVEMASNAPTNAAGIGGAPGEGVIIKAGAVDFEPKNVIDGDNWYRLNIDKGNQAAGGEDIVILGNVGVADNITSYALIKRTSPSVIRVKTDSLGSLWLIIGTDSGFEGLTELYYSDIKVNIKSE